MKHKDKKKLAKKMLTREERKNHTPIFQSRAWSNRIMARIEKEKKKRIKKES